MEKFIKKKILRKIKKNKIKKNLYSIIDKIKGINKKQSAKYKSKFSKLC